MTKLKPQKIVMKKSLFTFFTSRPKVRFDLSRKIKIGKNIGEIFLNLIINCSEKEKLILIMIIGEISRK